MLEAVKEYIALVTKHLSPEDVKSWVNTGGTDWNRFFCILEKVTKCAHQVQVLNETRSGFNTVTQKKCDHCTGEHPTKFCRIKKPKTVLMVEEKKLC